VSHCCRFRPWWWCHPARRAALHSSYGRRPSIYREGEPTEGWGNPEGVPRSQTARALKIFKVKKCARALRLWITLCNPRQCWIWKSRAWVIERIGRG
jgi:hypothetical protein